MRWIKNVFFSVLEYAPEPTKEEQEHYIEIGEFQVSDCPYLVGQIAKAIAHKLEEKRGLVHRFAPSYSNRLPYFQTPESFFSDDATSKTKPEQLLLSERHLKAYLAYVERTFPALAGFFFTRLKFRIPEEARKKHTYILGGSGSGKTELMKVMMYPYINKRNRNATVILFDPHGDVAEQVGRWKQHQDGETIVYIDPSLKNGFVPCLNPLEIPANTSPQMVNYMAECITEVFKEIVGKESNITANMGTLLKAVLTVLLKKPDSTLKDLQTFMRDEENADLVEYAARHSPKGQRHFFQHTFYDSSYTPTKKALYTKLQDLFNSQAFYDLTVGKSTLDLRELMDSKKTVIFNLSKGKIGEQTSSAFGRFILALIQGFSFQRQDIPKKDRVPTHVFLDEFHNFVTPSIQTILDESRKYGIHLTLVQQFYGQKTDTQLRASIMNNTAIKICGTGEDTSLEKMAKVMTGATKDDLQNCERGQFYIKVKKQGGILQQAFGTNYARSFRNTTELLDFRNAMNVKQWKSLKQQQLETYYRSTRKPRDQEKENADFSPSTSEENAPWRNDGFLKSIGKKILSQNIHEVKNTAPDWFAKHIKPEAEKTTSPNAPQTENDPQGTPSTHNPQKPIKNDSVINPLPDTNAEPAKEISTQKLDDFTPKFDL